MNFSSKKVDLSLKERNFSLEEVDMSLKEIDFSLEKSTSPESLEMFKIHHECHEEAVFQISSRLDIRNLVKNPFPLSWSWILE